ncbi:uncharacterized protein LOC128680930 isoform X2 [Plodia interpunctella]|uniref:uncharacterized protein LOC128680930 isoform X2 n=1 Tax=Plodia interpunctella TaxID=58824 RepID=UPI0023681D46|nr:uncharacterized protein LOC128680930 isoform X2 [Plodia interpunctella]
MQGNKSQALVFKVMSFGKKSGEPKESKEEMLARKSEAKKKELEAKSEKLEKKKQLQIEKEAEKERRKAEAKAKKEEKEKKTLETTMAAKEKEESKHLCLCDEDLDMMGPSRSEILANAEEHQLPIVAYNNKRKFKDYTHSRDYGVAYNRDVEAYHYRGYDINPPIAGQDFGAVKESTKWVQYMSHAERHKRFYPYRMNYIPTDNSFVQLVLIIHLLACLFTLLCTICCKYIKQLHRLLAYEIIWLPGCIGVVFTSYMLLCSACSRKFPLNYTLLFINMHVASLCTGRYPASQEARCDAKILNVIDVNCYAVYIGHCNVNDTIQSPLSSFILQGLKFVYLLLVHAQTAGLIFMKFGIM